MSRAALWRQEANVKERERHANETFENALEEGRSRAQKGLIPMKDDRTFNLNPMLLSNISKSPYFIKICSSIKDWTTLVDEIYYEVKHAEPWTQGAAKTPSTAFCLLLRLFCLRCTEKQMKLMLHHDDSPYIRIIGFLYLRYTADPSTIWTWYRPYLYDEEMVRVECNVKQPEITMGTFVRRLLTDLEYHRTRLPRFPVTVERDIQRNLIQEERIERRAVANLANPTKMTYFQRVGSRIQALYGDEDNPVTWYDAVVDRVIQKDDVSGVELVRPKFVVTFPEYGNTETVSVGEMDMPGVNTNTNVNVDMNVDRGVDVEHSRGDDGVRRERDVRRGYEYDRRPRGDHDDRKRGYDDRHRDYDSRRDYSHSHHRDRDHRHGARGYHDDGHGRGGSSRRYDREDNHTIHRRRERSRSRDRDRDYSSGSGPRGVDATTATTNTTSSRHDRPLNTLKKEEEIRQPVKKTAEQLAAINEKKRKLLAKYG